MRAEDMMIRPVLSLLSKGRTGTGKTIASCGKEFRPVYVFDFEGRFDSVLTYYQKLDGHVKDIETDYFPMGSGFYGVDQRMDALAKSCPFKTVAIASLTSYIHLVLKHLIKSKEGQTRGSGQQARPAGKQIAGIRVNELEDFNAEDAAIIFELIEFLQMLKSYGTNIILECHISPYEVNTIDPETRGKDNYTINQILTKGKKAPAQIPGYFNEVYLFEKEIKGFGQKDVYKFNTRGTATDDCKTSWGIRGDEWTDKDFSQIIWEQIGKEIKDNPRVDPNAPKKVGF